MQLHYFLYRSLTTAPKIGRYQDSRTCTSFESPATAPEICLMQSGQLSSLVTPCGRLDVDSSKFPSVKIPRFVSRRTRRDTRRCQRRQNLLPIGDEVDVDLHTDTDNFAPNEYRVVVNSSGLAVYKGSRDKSATESKN